MTKDNNWGNSFNDYGFNHGFQSRGIAPSFLGSDSLPQGISDLHWALHGIQNNVDELDSKINTFNDNIADIAKGMKNNIIEYLGDKLAGSKTPLTTSTGYLSKIMTTRTRIFSDRFSAESSMNPVGRIRGLTKNYDWVQYTQANPTCEGEYDKIIDFNFISDFQENDAVDSLYVSKGRIILEKCGLIKRIHVTQKGSNIVVWYLVTQSLPSSTGVAYTGSIRRVEYDKNSNKISERWQQVNHTPLVFLGAFNIDANNDSEYIQYISTDYKVYQNINGIDTEMGHLPNEVILMIDPLNDIVSDSKQAYIMKYSDEGMLHFPLEGFTLIDTMDTGEIIEKFKKITFNPNSKIFNSISSISPRSSSMLTRTEEPNKVISNEGGYYIEIIDKNSVYPEVSHSHILLLSSSEEIYDVDRNTKTIFNYHSDYPSEFALKRERDYIEFDSITFGSKISRMFPEVAKDFGISDETRFTVQFDASRQKCRLTVWLDEPFVIERVIADSDVNNRLGYTVINNSDNVRDIADTDILSVYKQLDFTIKNPATRNYLTTLPKYDETYQLPKYLRYHVVEHSDTEHGDGKIEITYFDEVNSISATIDAPRKEIIGNIKYNENLTEIYNKRSNKFSPSVKSQYLSDLIHSDVIYLEGKDFLDKPYGSKQYVLKNETTGSRVTQRLYTSISGNADTNNDSGTVFNNRVRKTQTFSSSITFTLPTNYETTSTTEQKPMSFDFVIDGSSSFSSKIRGAIDYVKYVIDNCITDPRSNIMIQLYTDNYAETYAGRGVNKITGISGMSSVLLNKVSAISLLERIKNVPLVSDPSTTIHDYGTYFTELAKAFGSDGWTSESNEQTPFEDIFDSQPNKHEDFSVLQITDGWIANKEKIDTSFVNWAKKARTFMSVLNRNSVSDTDTNSDQSTIEMKKAGHPNIYDMTGKDDSTVREELVRQFRETAIVKQNSRVIPTHVTIARTDIPSGVTLESTFTGGSLTNSSTMFSGDLQAGNYTLNVSATGNVDSTKTITFNISSKSVNKSTTLTLTPHSSSGGNTLAKHYSNVPVEESVFTRTIVNGKVGEWFGSGYITELKYLNIPGSYNTGTLEDGNYFQSKNPSHEVFNNIVTRGIFVEGVTNNMTHVVYRLTNDIGLSMSYHNMVIREDRSDTVGYTSKPYRLMYDKWIPGEYVGNDDYPQGPDKDDSYKELLKQISILRSRSLSVTDTKSIDFTVTGNWNTDKRSSWNANTSTWTTDPNDVNISAVVKLSRETELHQSSNNQQVQLPNAIKIKNDGVYSPDYGLLVSDLVNKINELSKKVEQLSTNSTSTGNAVKIIVNSLIASGAWDPNKTNVNPGNAPITGGIKDGVNIAYGNINLFGGTPDGNSYIRTNKGQTENDLAGGI